MTMVSKMVRIMRHESRVICLENLSRVLSKTWQSTSTPRSWNSHHNKSRHIIGSNLRVLRQPGLLVVAGGHGSEEAPIVDRHLQVHEKKIFRCARKKSSGERSSRLCTTVVHSCQNESWVVVVVSALVRSHHPSRSDKYQRLSFSFTWMQQFSQWLSCYDGRRPKVQAAVPFLFSFRRTSGSVCLAMPPIVVKSRDVPTHGAALHKNAAVIHHSFLCIRPPSLIWHNFFAFNRLSFSLLKCKSHSFSSSPNKCCDSDIS